MHELNGGSVSIWMFDNRGFCIRAGLIGDRGFKKVLRGWFCSCISKFILFFST